MQTGASFPGSDSNLINSSTSNPMAPLGWGSTVTPPTQGGNPRPQNSVQMPGNGSGGGRLPAANMPPPPAANGAQLHNNGATTQQQATLLGSMPNPMPWQGTPAAASSSMAPGGVTVMQKGQEGGGGSRWSNTMMPPPTAPVPTSMATNNPRSLGNNDLGGSKEGSNTASAGNSQDPSLGWGGAASNASSKSPLGSSWGNPVGAPAPTSQWGEQQQKTSPQWGEPPKSAGQQWATQQPPPPSGQSQDQWGGMNPATVDSDSANTPKSQPSTWAQAAGKGLVTKSSPTGENPNEDAMPPIVDEYDRVINSNEGWGQRPVRQDTAWDTPESPQTKRKLNEKGTNSWNNNNNGTAIWEGSKDSAPPVVNWNNSHGNPASSQWDGGEDKIASNNWGVAPTQKPPQQIGVNSSAMVGGDQPNNWGGGGLSDPRSSGSTWASGQSRPPPQPPQSMGNKTESSAWAANIPPPRTASWGEPPIEAAPSSWQEPSPTIQRRQLSSSSQMPIDPGTPGYWGDAPPKQQTSWSGNSNPSTPATPMTPRPMPEDQQWNKAPPKPPQPGGWGDPSPPNVKVDDGTSLWAANAQQQVSIRLFTYIYCIHIY